MILLSVIVPVYNTQEYVSQCIESILGQKYEDIELILVDDGSSDASGEICDEYERMDKRVHVLHKNHQGPIMARAEGVMHAQGEYITFVDSDDWIKRDTYECMIEAMGNADMVISGICRYYDEKNIQEEIPRMEKGIYHKEALERNILPVMMWSRQRNHWELDPSLCTKIFKRQLITKYLEKAKDLDFHYGDDAAVMYPLMLELDSMVVLHECFYFHRQRRPEEGIPYIGNDSEYFEKLFQLYQYLKYEFTESRYRELMLVQLEHFYMNAIKLKQKCYTDYREMNEDVFPYWKVDRKNRIILYGAGELGREYFRQNQMYQFCSIVMWADRNYAKLQPGSMDIVSPDRIGNIEFDYLLIAVKSMELAMEIKRSFIKKGVPGDKIIWNMIRVTEADA